MDWSDDYWYERNGPAPRSVPVVAAVKVRTGEQRGVEFHLAEDPGHTVARVWTDGRITLGLHVLAAAAAELRRTSRRTRRR